VPDAGGAGAPEGGVMAWENDVHSGLNRTEVARVERPPDIMALREAVRRAAGDGLPISVCGGRHAMGGQQFCAGSALVDTGGLDRVVSFDGLSGTIEVEAGIQWPALVAWLRAQQDGVGGWGIVQKQTGADRLSIGGAVSANIHGRGLRLRPIVQDVVAITVMDADGDVRRCTRSEVPELFACAVGGYGLFGIIVSVTLRLARRRKLRRLVEVITSDELMAAFARRRDEGCLYGDFQFSTDEASPDFVRRGVFSCYLPVDDATPSSTGHVELDADDWRRLYRLAHQDRAELYRVYESFYRSTDGQVYWSDAHQMSVYLDGYHAELDAGRAVTRSEMISELYVPRAALAAFLSDVSDDFRRHHVEVIYGTVRLVERDDETLLAWARQDWACTVVNLCVTHDAAGIAKAGEDFRRLIAAAQRHGGSYFLTYHRWATRAQAEACHPRLREFLARKRAHDPAERFQSDWYRHHLRLLGIADSSQA
jgi:FAD/FMN-containing dehydrogenase